MHQSFKARPSVVRDFNFDRLSPLVGLFRHLAMLQDFAVSQKQIPNL
jgi:hypothetical protein